MKKLFFSAVAFATLLFAASCQQESLEPVAGDGSVTYTVQMPSSIATKAVGDDLEGQYKLIYEVYRAGEIDDLSKDPLYEGTADFSGNVATVQLQFVKRQDYMVLFWAQAKDLTLFETEDLREVSMKNAWAGNDLATAVFAGTDEVSDCVSAKKGNVTLVRPVSQINIATSNASLAVGGTNSGQTTKTITMSTVTVAVKGLHTVYNVWNKEVSEGVQNVSFTEAEISKLPAEFNSDYKYVAMNYVGFAPVNGTTVDVDFSIVTNEGEIDHKVANVPIKANYRTNILGNLITEENKYTVTIDTQWADNGGNMEFVTDGLVKNLDGVYDVTSAKGLAYAINNLFEEGGNFYLTESVYDLTDFAVLLPDVPAGVTLNLYGEAHVVTRSSVTLGGVTIIGLPATTTGAPALINSVAEGAAVSVSGVTLADDNSVLVNVNNGSVVVSETVADTIVREGEVLNADEVTTLAELQAALASGVETITVTGQIVIKNQEVTLDLNGKTVNGVYSTTGANYNLIDVNSNAVVTVKNGTITAKFTGANMGWNASTNVFNVTAGGVLNLENVTAQNLGGSDMAFVAHLNNWGEVTLNVNNSTLESPYIAVRVFNSGNDMNNVTIQNSTLKGKYCFWVHNYTLADFGTQDKVDAQKALLNFDIFNGTNKFECTNTYDAPVLYGFTNPIYVDENGNEIVSDGVVLTPEGEYLISNAAGLNWFAGEVNKHSNYEYPFQDKVIKLTSDINLEGCEWTPIGDYRFSANRFCGTFDGQGHTVSNFKITKKTDKNDSDKSAYGFFGNLEGNVKNLTLSEVTIYGAPKFIGAMVGRFSSGLIENCHVKNSSVTCNNWTIGGIVGQFNDGKISGCSVEKSTITGYAAVGAIAGIALNAGERTIENCVVKDCNIVKNGSFGGNYDNMFGNILGATYSGELTVYINNCSATGCNESDICGWVEEGDRLFIDGYEYIAPGLMRNTAEKTWAISSAEGLVAMSSLSIKGNEKVVLTADIDLAGLDFNGLSAFNSENPNIFDGQGHTVSNWTYSGKASDMGFIKSWVGTIKNLTITDSNLLTSGRSAILAGNVYANIDNCHVVNCSIEDSYWACGLIAGLYNSGSVSNCSVVNSSVKSNGGTGAIVGVLNDSSGTRSFTNCKVEGCTVENTGVYGEGYCGALVCGMINISNSTIKFIGCEMNDNTKEGNFVGDLYYAAEGNTIVVE